MSDARLHIRQSPNLGRKTEFWVESGDVWVEISNLFTGFDYTVMVNDLPELRLDVYPMAVTLHPPEWKGGPPAPLVTLPDEPLPPLPRTGPPKQAPDVIPPGPPPPEEDHK